MGLMRSEFSCWFFNFNRCFDSWMKSSCHDQAWFQDVLVYFPIWICKAHEIMIFNFFTKSAVHTWVVEGGNRSKNYMVIQISSSKVNWNHCVFIVRKVQLSLNIKHLHKKYRLCEGHYYLRANDKYENWYNVIFILWEFALQETVTLRKAKNHVFSLDFGKPHTSLKHTVYPNTGYLS